MRTGATLTGGMAMAKAKYTRDPKTGYWSTKAWDGTFNPDGTKHRINLRSSKSSRDLERKVEALRAQVAEGSHVKHSDYTFQEYARLWLETKKSVREINTRAMYENIIEKHFDRLADVRLADIRNSHFQMVISAASDRPRTCQQIYITFKQIIRMAVSDCLIAPNMEKLIISDISLPKYVKAEKRALSQAEKGALHACLSSGVLSPREHAFLTLIYYCGFRKGEALALTRFDCCLGDAPSISINKALIFVKNNSQIKPFPKSDRGIRKVPLPAAAARYLSGYLASLDGTILFPGANSTYISKSSYDKMWASILRKLDDAAGGTRAFPVITGLTAHIFRHNYCSNLCYQIPDISIGKIAELMGDTEKMVLNVYNHIIDEKEDVATALEQALAL